MLDIKAQYDYYRVRHVGIIIIIIIIIHLFIYFCNAAGFGVCDNVYLLYVTI